MPDLQAYRRNVHSQDGEDGVLEEILRRLGIGTGSFVEFGAWDGKTCSNTFHLLEQGWKGVYIESDGKRYRKLVENMKPFAGRVTTVQAIVEPTGPSSLDALLASAGVPPGFEVLSIDVDSLDWQIWEGFRDFQPAVVIIEINSHIPVGIYQTHRGEKARGASFTATVDLGARKGYTAVCHTGNLFFVRNTLVPGLGLPQSDLQFPETLFDYGWKRVAYEEPLPPNLVRLSRILARIGRLKNRLRALVR